MVLCASHVFYLPVSFLQYGEVTSLSVPESLYTHLIHTFKAAIHLLGKTNVSNREVPFLFFFFFKYVSDVFLLFGPDLSALPFCYPD